MATEEKDERIYLNADMTEIVDKNSPDASIVVHPTEMTGRFPDIVSRAKRTGGRKAEEPVEDKAVAGPQEGSRQVLGGGEPGAKK